MHLFCDLQQVAGSEAILYHPIAALMDSANLTFGLWDTLTYPHPLTYPHTLTYTHPLMYPHTLTCTHPLHMAPVKMSSVGFNCSGKF